MPVTTTQSAIALPDFRYTGIDNSAHILERQLYNDLGPGEPAYVLSPRSAPASLKVSLYRVGRDLTFGLNDADNLPESVKEAGRLVYEDCEKRFETLFLIRITSPKDNYCTTSYYDSLHKIFSVEIP